MLANEHIRYEPEDRLPPSVTLIVALQGTVLVVSNTMVITGIFAAAFDDDGTYLTWAIFAALVVAGSVTALQATRLGRLGSGHVMLSGPGVTLLAVCVLAVEEGGLPLMASLVVASSLVHFAVAAWLARLRRLITPVVAGVAFMLIAVSAMPIAVGRLDDVPAGSAPEAGAAAGVLTLVAAALLMLRGSGLWRLWAIPLAVVAGCAAAAPLGVYDPQPALDARWFDLPAFSAWPGFAPVTDPTFWALLIVFLVVNAAVAVRASSEGAAIQQASRRRPRSIDFRSVQGTTNAGGASILLSGLAGAPPAITYLATSTSLIAFTGVAARRAGLAIGVLVIALALLPKVVGVLVTIPRPVTGGLLLIMMGMLFVDGMRTVFRDGLGQQRAFIVGVSLSIAIGLQNQNVVAELVGGAWGVALGNTVVAGVLIALAMTGLLELASARSRRLRTTLDAASFPEVEDFLRRLGAGLGWDGPSVDRLCAAGEETLSSMLSLRDDYEGEGPPRLLLLARPGSGTVELEFLALFSEENIEDRIAYISEQAEEPEVGDIAFRLLRHYASSVRHRKYYGIDIVTVEIEGSRG